MMKLITTRECYASANRQIYQFTAVLLIPLPPARPPHRRSHLQRADSPPDLSPAFASHTHSGVRVVVRFVYQPAHPSRLSARRRDDLFNKLTYTFISHPFPPRLTRVRIITALTVRCGAHPSHAPTTPPPPPPHSSRHIDTLRSAPLWVGLFTHSLGAAACAVNSTQIFIIAHGCRGSGGARAPCFLASQ